MSYENRDRWVVKNVNHNSKMVSNDVRKDGENKKGKIVPITYRFSNRIKLLQC